MKATLHPYQEYSKNFILDHPYCALLLDMGLGKTLSSLTAIDELLHTFEIIENVLVIAPLSVAEKTWTDEIEKWDHLQHLTFSKVLGNPKQREEALFKKADVYLINRENVEWLVNYYQRNWPFKTVIIDELSSFKSSSAKRFKALRKVRPKMERVIGLTGTPSPNSLMDLWAQMYLLDQGERLGKTITQYRNKYFAPHKKRAYCLFLAVNPRSRRGDLQQNKRYMREYESKRLFTATTTNGKYYRARLEPDKLETVQRARTGIRVRTRRNRRCSQ